jgi:hypothetical protein
MLLRTKLYGKTYEFPDLRLLMGKANEEKSGDRLAGVAAERVAARFVLAEMPLWVLRQHPADGAEDDAVSGQWCEVEAGSAVASCRSNQGRSYSPVDHASRRLCPWRSRVHQICTRSRYR